MKNLKKTRRMKNLKMKRSNLIKNTNQKNFSIKRKNLRVLIILNLERKIQVLITTLEISENQIVIIIFRTPVISDGISVVHRNLILNQPRISQISDLKNLRYKSLKLLKLKKSRLNQNKKPLNNLNSSKANPQSSLKLKLNQNKNHLNNLNS